MIQPYLIALAVLFKNLICPCHQDKKISHFTISNGQYKVRKAGKLPLEINESSGLVQASNNNTYWTHNDNSGNVKLYEINLQGQILSRLEIEHTFSQDLEEITKDDGGNLYLGDFGNNSNTRINLRIYKVNLNKPTAVDTISFSYPDQLDFPPAIAKKNFDCEAFFYYKDSLYLFSKNRGGKTAKIYRLPAKPGNYIAELVQKVYVNSMVTGAALRPDKKAFALMSYGKVYFFKISEGKFFAETVSCRRFSRGAQTEAITYINDTDLLISNEGGYLFLLSNKKKNSDDSK